MNMKLAFAVDSVAESLIVIPTYLYSNLFANKKQILKPTYHIISHRKLGKKAL